ncbi:MAG TPA: S8 family serine peptidase [Fibrobacteria bacterium]|nr:S8 family serine peptidase [Fibrobacteria bacterium]
MRASLPILAAAGLVAAATGPRWLRLPDKGSAEPVRGSLAWEDAPLREDLLDSLREMGWTLRARFRWENMVSAVPPPGGEPLPAGVVDAGPVGVGRRNPTPVVVAPHPFSARAASVDPYTSLLKAIWDTLGIDAARKYLLANGELPGLGKTIAFIDGHFQPTHPMLQGADIGDAHDFLGPDTLPWDSAGIYDMHGTQTSAMVASSDSLLPGIAPYARFLFYRVQTDAPDDTIVEEDYLASAIVRAVDHGADVISISLGFRWVDPQDQIPMYPWSAFDGRTIPGSIAATDAAKHGVVVVVAAGNDGDVIGSESIGSPADADSVLTVGAVDISDGLCGFSSWGPTYDGRTKPDVDAPGCDDPVAGPGPGYRTYGAGTSFAAPLVAGMAVLSLQMAPGIAGENLVLALRASGTSNVSPDPKRGWGVPSLARVGRLEPILSQGGGGSPLPQVWSPSRGPLLFSASSAQTQGHLGVEMRDIQGRVLFRWEGPWLLGANLWNPSSRDAPRQGIKVLQWWGDYGSGASTIYIAP